MKKIITFRSYNTNLGYFDQRLLDASHKLIDSLTKFDIGVHQIFSNDQYITVKDTLEAARANTEHSYFVWSNTDVIWDKDPFEGLEEGQSYGFHRQDIWPNGDRVINYGVDAYRIDNKFYDDIMSKDIPYIWNGCDRTDWYCSRCIQKYGTYTNHVGYITHPYHERYPGSAGISELGRHSRTEFEKWADRHGVSKT